MEALVILPRSGFDDDDLLEVLKIFDIKVATINREPAIGKKGSIVIPDYDIEDIVRSNIRTPNILILIGDEGINELDNSIIKTIVAGFLVPGKYLILISLAPILVSKFKLIPGRTVTYNRKLGDYDYFLRNYGVVPSHLNYSVDDNLITISRGKYINIVADYIKNSIL